MILPDRGRGVDTPLLSERASCALTNAEAALAIARTQGPVLPLCPVTETGKCICGGKWDDKLKQMVEHADHEIGKAPIGRLVKTGVLEATTNSATIDRWWRAVPNANVGLALEPSRVLFVDPDSPEALAEARANGLEGGSQRDSRNVGWLFRRPSDCPVLNISKSADHTDLELRTVGYAVVYGTHGNGAPVRINPYQPLQDAPAWTVDRLKAKAAEKATQDAIRQSRRAERSTHGGNGPPVRLHTRGMRRWSGELVQTKPSGETDRSDSLYLLALDLADGNASEATIAAALENRDAALGWNKYTGRDDAEKQYQTMAEKAVAWVVDREQQPQLKATKPADVPDEVPALRAALEEAEATINRLRRRILDADDRLEVLEPIVNQIEAIISRPDEELSSDDKIVDIGLIRWLPYHQAKRAAKGEPPTIALGYLSKVIGMPKKRISKSLERQSSKDPNDGAPFRKKVTRHFNEDEQRWESSMEVQPWGETPVATLRAAATFTPAPRPKRGGSKRASDARWGRCDKHQNDMVQIKGYCPDCGKVLGERVMSVDEFDALNVQVEHSEETASPCVGSNPIDVQLGHSDDAPTADEPLNVQVVDSDLPVSLLDYAATRSRSTAPVRCTCRCMEYDKRPDGWRCLKCGTVYDPPVFAKVGGGTP